VHLDIIERSGVESQQPVTCKEFVDMLLSQGPIKYANIDENTAASNAIVALVASRGIRILAFCAIAAADVTVTLEDEDGANLIGPMDLPANGGVVLPFNGIGWQETPSGKALHLLLGDAVQVGGSITYQEVQI